MGFLSSRSGCCSLHWIGQLFPGLFGEQRIYIFLPLFLYFYCVYLVRTCSRYILSSLPSNFIWPFSSRNYTFNTVNPYIDVSTVVSLGCVKLVVQVLSQDGIMRTAFPEFLLVNNRLCSVTLTVSFAKYVILGLHFLSLSLLNMFLYFILGKKHWKLLKTDVIFFCFPCK